MQDAHNLNTLLNYCDERKINNFPVDTHSIINYHKLRENVNLEDLPNTAKEEVKECDKTYFGSEIFSVLEKINVNLNGKNSPIKDFLYNPDWIRKVGNGYLSLKNYKYCTYSYGTNNNYNQSLCNSYIDIYSESIHLNHLEQNLFQKAKDKIQSEKDKINKTKDISYDYDDKMKDLDGFLHDINFFEKELKYFKFVYKDAYLDKFCDNKHTEFLPELLPMSLCTSIIKSSNRPGATAGMWLKFFRKSYGFDDCNAVIKEFEKNQCFSNRELYDAKCVRIKDAWDACIGFNFEL